MRIVSRRSRSLSSVAVPGATAVASNEFTWAEMSRPQTASLPPSLGLGSKRGALLDRQPGVEHALFVEGLAYQLQPEREAIGIEPGGYAHRREPGEASGNGEHVVQIHRDRVVALLAEREGGARGGRGENHV